MNKSLDDEGDDFENRAARELRHFSLDWDAVTKRHLNLLKARLRSAVDERSLQSLLEKHKKLLVQHLGGGHDRWVIPRLRLGSKYIPDFVIGELNSLGFHWQLVELESPRAKLFTKAGDPSQELNHAIRQIEDWRRWLGNNLDHARRSRLNDGLGLKDITQNAPGLILIGRRREQSQETNERRKQMSMSLGIKIHTYDFLVERLQVRLRDLGVR